MGEIEAENLLSDLDSVDVEVKKRAIFNIGRKGIKPAVPKLIDLLKNDEDSVVRNSAARALGKIQDPDMKDTTLTALMESLSDPDYYVKANACWSLGKLKDPKAIPALSEMVDPSKRLYATIGDGKTLGSESEQDASAKLKEEGVKYSDIILEAIKALGTIKDPQGVPALIRALKDESDGTVRCKAALALGKIKDKQAIQPLIDALQEEKYWYVKRDLILALKKLKAVEAIPELMRKTKDMYADVQNAAYEAIFAMGKPAYKPIVRLFLQQPKNEKIKGFLTTSFTPEDMKNTLQELINESQNKAEKENLQAFLDQMG